MLVVARRCGNNPVYNHMRWLWVPAFAGTTQWMWRDIGFVMTMNRESSACTAPYATSAIFGTVASTDWLRPLALAA
ncbi:hypothetical protein ACVIGA_003411 [Bradyrhizobium sp. USDA 3240]